MEPPYRLLKGIQSALDGYFASFNPIEVAPQGLNIRTCCYAGDEGRLLVGLMNNDLFADWQGEIRMRGRRLRSAQDLRHDLTLHVSRDRVKVIVSAGDVTILDLRLQ